MQRHTKTVFLVVGRTSSGKDSLVEEICKNEGYKQLKSYATRPKRQGEGNTHTFITKDEVAQYKNDMIAYTQIGEYEYFATKQQLLESDFYIIDYRGIEYMKSLPINLNDIRFVTICIKAPDSMREARALGSRHDHPEIFYKRCFTEDKQFTEMAIKEDYDYVITNECFDKAYNIFKEIVNIELNYYDETYHI